MALPFGRRLEERLRSSLPIPFHTSLDRSQRHSEHFGDLPLRRRPVDDELRREQPKTGQVISLVREHRQVAIQVYDLVLFSLDGQFRSNRAGAVRKHRQLNLRHGPEFYLSRPSGKRKSAPPPTPAPADIWGQSFSTTTPAQGAKSGVLSLESRDIVTGTNAWQPLTNITL